jgi:hypothetical protein
MSSKPIITPEFLESLVARIEWHLFDGTRTIACALTLGNGFSVIGLAHALPTTEFNPRIGSDLAKADAFRKLAEIVGFVVADSTVDFRVTEFINQHAVNALKEHKDG